MRLFLTFLFLTVSAEARSPKIPPDAPYCAAPGARPLFVSPMGEPFRAAPGAAYPSAQWFARADGNHDGSVDRAEMVADARRFFKTLDKDGDGRLTPEEVDAYERDVAPEIAIYGAARVDRLAGLRPDEGDYGGPRGAGRFAWLNIPEPVASADADMNRLVDAGEFAAAASRRFDAVAQGRTGLRLVEVVRTPLQRSIEGPCWPRPKERKGGPARFRHAGDQWRS
jgi:hypothetical protein